MCFTALNGVSTKISNEVARGLGRKNLRCLLWCYCLYFNQAPPPLQMKNPHTMQANELNIGMREQ